VGRHLSIFSNCSARCNGPCLLLSRQIFHLALMAPHVLTRTPLYVALCSNTYSALNALAGHYNSFGATAPIPKKRLERLTKVRRHGLTDQWFWRGGEKGGRRQQLGVLWHCKHS
jgi:hypothetical protein